MASFPQNKAIIKQVRFISKGLFWQFQEYSSLKKNRNMLKTLKLRDSVEFWSKNQKNKIWLQKSHKLGFLLLSPSIINPHAGHTITLKLIYINYNAIPLGCRTIQVYLL